MKGRKQLVFSKGLKARFEVEEKTDEDIMLAGGEQDEELLATIARDLWRGVYRHEVRGELLQLLGLGDVAEARVLLRSLGLDDSGLTAAHNRAYDL
jgi:hypothetical protein